MDPETLFLIATRATLPCWLLLIVLPRWKWSTRLVTIFVPVLLGGLYLVLVWRYFGRSGGGYGALGEVRTLFEHPWMLLAGWVHYLAFDLFVGAWEARDAQRLGIHQLLLMPCLALTLMFGPVGLLAYLILRFALNRQIWIGEEIGS